MKLTLRSKFMAWLMALVAVVYLALGGALFGFNLHERREHPDAAAEEVEELLIIYGLMAGVLPIAFFAAWRVTDKLLQPLREMLETARCIQQGGTDQRLKTPVATDELGQLAVTLNEAFDNYQSAVDRLDRFSLDAAHQLRNPLASIRTAGEICLQKDRSAIEYREVIGRMVEDARRLGYTVDQLLLVARLARRDLAEVFESLDLADLASEAVETVRPAFESANVQLKFESNGGPLRLHGSARLLEQAVANLLDNALRFTPSGGIVKVKLSAPYTGRINLEVGDSGPGLGFLSHRHSGRPAQSAANFRGKEGTGLGLLVVSNVVRAHGGTVQATISELGGACFLIELPSEIPQPDEHAQPAVQLHARDGVSRMA